MNEAQRKVVPDPEVVCTELQNKEGILLHLGTHCYFSLNETGVQIWQLMSKGLNLGEIGRELEARFEVSAEEARKSVLDLAAELEAEKLVSVGVEQDAHADAR